MLVLLVSTYELGHQPLGLAAPAAALRAAGHEVICIDSSVESPEGPAFGEANLVAISTPMHTAARLGIALAHQIRDLNPQAYICFYGLYASPLAALLTGSGLADSVIGGEYEPALCNLADALAGARAFAGSGLGSEPAFPRQRFPVPDRRGLPALDRYAHAHDGTRLRVAGYVEATRGCAHRCTHCPLTPVYEGRLRLVQSEVVLADVDQLAGMGAEHITFGDPDFLNAPSHSLAIVEELQRRHPGLTFDVTIKVEHLLEHAAVLPRLRELGCLFLTSAFESCNDAILSFLKKGHTRQDLDRAVALAGGAGLAIRPTWVAFTPWTTLGDFLEILDFVEGHRLVGHVQAVQYALRLLLPPGSPLVPLLEGQGLLGPFDEEGLGYTWQNPNPGVEELQLEVAAIVEEESLPVDGSDLPDPAQAFGRIKDAAKRARGLPADPPQADLPLDIVPGLTEAWFC